MEKRIRDDGEEPRGYGIGLVACPLASWGPSVTCNAHKQPIFYFFIFYFYFFLEKDNQDASRRFSP